MLTSLQKVNTIGIGTSGFAPPEQLRVNQRLVVITLLASLVSKLLQDERQPKEDTKWEKSFGGIAQVSDEVAAILTRWSALIPAKDTTQLQRFFRRCSICKSHQIK